jgi:hypothetical protein
MRKISVSQSSENRMKLPPEEMASRDRCFRLSGACEPFPIDDVDATVPAANCSQSTKSSHSFRLRLPGYISALSYADSIQD